MQHGVLRGCLEHKALVWSLQGNPEWLTKLKFGVIVRFEVRPL